jgi:hypothetical protein
MTIELTLEPAVEAKLSVLAAARGMRTEEFVSQTVAELLAPEHREAAAPDEANLDDFIERLVSISRGHVVQTGETYSREMIYADQPKIP